MKKAVGLVLIGIVSVQFGAAIAKNLFNDISPTTLVWLRLTTSAGIMLILTRGTRLRLSDRSRQDWVIVAGFGVSLGLMNWAIYQSFARIPLGLAVTIEFIGPLTLAVIGSRQARDLIWVALAVIGVGLLGIEPGDLTIAGVAYALLAGAAWAAYILLSARTGQSWSGLSVASLIAALAMTPWVVFGSGVTLIDKRILVLGLLVGLLSSVVPYSLELVALRTLTAGTFGILMSLEPAAAALAAMLILSEFLSPLQWLAVACVVIASVGATQTAVQKGSSTFHPDVTKD
jgi:inner membrane transporter RhtA